MYKLDLDLYFNTQKSNEFPFLSLFGKGCVQGRLQLACTGDPIVIHVDDDGTQSMMPGPVMDLAMINVKRLARITDMYDLGKTEQAEREMIQFALEEGVVYIDGSQLEESIEFAQHSLRRVPDEE